MTFNNCELKAAASKGSPAFREECTLSFVNSTTSVLGKNYTPIESIQNFSNEEQSLDVSPTKEVYEKQTGQEELIYKVQQALKHIAAYSGFSFAQNETIVNEIENLVALMATLQGTRNMTSAIAAIYLYVKGHSDRSFTGMIMNYVEILLQFETQDGTEDITTTTDWIDLMRDCRSNWSQIRNNKFFAHFSKLLGLLVTMNLCKASNLTFHINEFKVWEPNLTLKHKSAVDIIDAALNTVTYFVETISLCIRDRSLTPLLSSDSESTDIDEEYTTITLWWDLVRNGNLGRVTKETGREVSEKEFDCRLEALATKLKNMMGVGDSFEKRIITDKFMRLCTIKNDYINTKINSGVRRAPYAIEYFGDSSQGKTTIGDQITDALLVSANLPLDKKYRATVNASDNFMSNWTTDKVVMNTDDVAQDKSNFVTTPPTRLTIDVCNNEPYYANVAHLEGKGRIFVEPNLYVASTNKKNMDAGAYSNCPYSVQRRFHAVITVKAKRQFQYIVDGEPQGIDPSKIRAFYEETGHDPVFDDIWTLTVEKAVKPRNISSLAGYAPISFRGKPLVDVDFRTAVQYLIEDFQRHNEAQDAIINRMNKRVGRIEKCPHLDCNHIKGYCDLHDSLPIIDEVDEIEKQFGEEIANQWSKSTNQVWNTISKDIFGLERFAEGATVFVLATAAKQFSYHWDWMKFIPTPWLELDQFQNLLLFINRVKITRNYIALTIINTLFFVGCCWYFWKTNLSYLVVPSTTLVCVSLQKSMINIVKEGFFMRLRRRNSITPVIQQYRDEHVARLCAAVTAIGIVYTISRFYSSWKSMSIQGSLEPKTDEEIKQRDSEVNVWTKVVDRFLPLPITEEISTTTSSQLEGLVAKNLVYGTVAIGERKLMVNGLFLTSNVVLIPNHYFEIDNLDVTFRKKNPEASGGKFAVRLDKSSSIKLPNTDLRICYASSGGSFRNLIKYLPTDTLPDHEFSMIWRAKNGEITNAKGLCALKHSSNGAEDFIGLVYTSLTINTFKGLCGAVTIARCKPLITGIHVGGKNDTPRGCAAIPYQRDVIQALEQLKRISGVLITGSAENFETQVLGVNILTKKDLHPKSALNYMPPDSQVEYYGSCTGMTTFNSLVKPTVISEIVTDVTGVPNKWGPPVQHPQYFGWQSCLSNLAVPALPFHFDVLKTAVDDYKSGLIPIYQQDRWKVLKPLSDHENLCGVPGVRFLDAIKLDTSVGFPLGGPKRRFVIELPPTDDKPNNRVFESVIMDEIKRCEDCYRRGERAYTIAKACKKDEILSKPKCRIFYGNSIALTYLVRKYFLPIIRVLQIYPLKSECAVGINAYGPEWQQLHDHVLNFGKDRIIGGDYGKYDQKLPSQVILAALRILIDFARECDYTNEDLSIMEAMAGDIAFAVIAYNGDLIGLTEGTHISGNSLTVIINGICGSLNLRSYFYSHHSHNVPFRDYVKLMTYGDDNIGSVSSKIDNFTIKGASEFLAKYGQTYTMPDKESELLDFLPFEEFEFLKRKSVYHPDIGMHLGALISDSCHKMLHCYLRDKNSVNTEEHACGINIDTALHEFFQHGPIYYEKKRLEMKEIAKRADITHLCNNLDATYDELVQEWTKQYRETEADL